MVGSQKAGAPALRQEMLACLNWKEGRCFWVVGGDWVSGWRPQQRENVTRFMQGLLGHRKQFGFSPKDGAQLQPIYFCCLTQ